MDHTQRPYIDRNLRPRVLEALSEDRVVCVLGPRQVGKSTSIIELASRDFQAPYRTLDNSTQRDAALADPTGYLTRLGTPAALDEIQRAPNLMLAIKELVDDPARQVPGQFLLSGSANLFTLPTIQDALPGRIGYLNLWPFSQGELEHHVETFIDGLFDGRFPTIATTEIGVQRYAERIVRGGYPAAYRRTQRGRTRFFNDYVQTILGRDVPEIAEIRRSTDDVGRLLRLLATQSSCLINWTDFGQPLGLSQKTTRRYTDILSQLFLIREVPSWHPQLRKRETSAGKLYLTDTGLLSSIAGVSDARLLGESETRLRGRVIETFVFCEVLRQLGWAETECEIYHYRERNDREIDLILESPDGRVVGLETKSSADAAPRDFRHLAWLRDELGERFVAGCVLYTGRETLSFGDRLAAVPLCGLWRG